jgi:hypothetical protein
MALLPSAGGGIASPLRKQSELTQVLTDLCRGYAFDDVSTQKYYSALGGIISVWWSEKERLKAEPVAKLLRASARNLSAVAPLLAGGETGLRNDTEIAVATRVLEITSMNPAIGSQEAAQELLRSFWQNAELLAHVFHVVAAELPTHAEKRGAKKKSWYDNFTALLLDIAEQADIKPTLYNRASDNKSLKGWLLDASRQLETFLPKEMRSTSDQARYKRLERSKANLSQRGDDKITSNVD